MKITKEDLKVRFDEYNRLYFDGKLISCDVKIVKPCPRIYELFTDKFGLDPEECLFVDDATANVAAAIACGWQGIVFHGDAEELKRKMTENGITAAGWTA